MSQEPLKPAAQVLPQHLEHYRSTPVFTEASVPAALLTNHSTKDGVWGHIRVLSGKLRYMVSDPRRLACSALLEPHRAPGIVEPTIVHRIEPDGHVEFQVEFFRRQS